MTRALVSPAIVAGLFTALAVLAAPSRRDELPDGADAGEGADGIDGRNGPTAHSAPWAERTAPPDMATPDAVNAALVLLALGYRSGLLAEKSGLVRRSS